MRALVPVFLTFFVSGCAGVGVFLPHTDDSEVGVDSAGRPLRTMDQVRTARHEDFRDGRFSTVEPRISQKDGREVWTYRYRNEWCGPLVVIVPIMLRICRVQDVYTFEGETLINHRRQRVAYTGLFCSVFPACDGHSCRACDLLWRDL